KLKVSESKQTEILYKHSLRQAKLQRRLRSDFVWKRFKAGDLVACSGGRFF
ncbi:mCG1042676, partial [Mus musculus]